MNGTEKQTEQRGTEQNNTWHDIIYFEHDIIYFEVYDIMLEVYDIMPGVVLFGSSLFGLFFGPVHQIMFSFVWF